MTRADGEGHTITSANGSRMRIKKPVLQDFIDSLRANLASAEAYNLNDCDNDHYMRALILWAQTDLSAIEEYASAQAARPVTEEEAVRLLTVLRSTIRAFTAWISGRSWP